MYATTTQRSGFTAAAGVARVREAFVTRHAGYDATCAHADKRNVLIGSWSIPSYMATAHKPEPRLLVTTS
jgi:hypothetical protein